MICYPGQLIVPALLEWSSLGLPPPRLDALSAVFVLSLFVSYSDFFFSPLSFFFPFLWL